MVQTLIAIPAEQLQEMSARLQRIEAAVLESNPATRRNLDDDLIQVEAVMTLTGKSKSAVYQDVRDHEIPAFKLGKRLLFRRSEVIAWATQNRLRTTVEPEIGCRQL